METGAELEQFCESLVKVRPPESWLEFANHHGVSEVWIVDDDRLPRSARWRDIVFVNV